MDTSQIDQLSSYLQIAINSGLAMRAIYIFLKLTHESDEAPQYKKCLKNTVVFAVIAQLPFLIENIIVSYLT